MTFKNNNKAKENYLGFFKSIFWLVFKLVSPDFRFELETGFI